MKIIIVKTNIQKGINRLFVNVLTDNGFSLTCFSIEIDAPGAKKV